MRRAGRLVAGTALTALLLAGCKTETHTIDTPSRADAGGTAPTAMKADPGRAITYTVRPGDSMWSLARKFYGDPTLYSNIQRANPGVDPVHLSIGGELTIPSVAGKPFNPHSP